MPSTMASEGAPVCVLVCFILLFMSHASRCQETDVMFLIDGDAEGASSGQFYYQSMSDLNFTTPQDATSICFKSMSFDPANGELYMNNCDMTRIYKAITHAPGMVTFQKVLDTNSFSFSYNTDGGIAVDWMNGTFFFGANRDDDSGYEIYRSRMDGTDINVFHSNSMASNYKIRDLALAHYERALYFVEDLDGVYNLVRCDVDEGDCAVVLYDTQTTYGESMYYITVDESDGKIYFTNYAAKVGSVNLNGTDLQIIGRVPNAAKKTARVRAYFGYVYFTTVNVNENKLKELRRVPKNGSASAAEDSETVDSFTYPNSLDIFYTQPCVAGLNVSKVLADEFLVEWDAPTLDSLTSVCSADEYQVTLQGSHDELTTLAWQNTTGVTIKATSGMTPFKHVFLVGRKFPRDGQEPVETDTLDIRFPRVTSEDDVVGLPLNLVMRKVWFGGFLADLEVHFNETVTSWSIDLDFRRQVHDFEIEGCKAEVSERIDGDLRRPKGAKATSFMIIPSPEEGPRNAGDVLRMTVVGKVWKRYRPRDNFVIGAELFTVSIEPGV